MDKIILLLIGSFLAINAVAQQPTFFGSTTKPQSSTTPTANAPRPVLSPSEFNNKVSEISTKNDAAFKQHLNQQLSKVPPPVVPKVAIPTASEHGTSSTSPLGTTETAPSAPKQMEEIVTSKTPAPTATVPPPVVQKNPESYSTTPPPSNSSGSGNSNTFTGFGTGSSGTTAPQKNQGGASGGGWNIKY